MSAVMEPGARQPFQNLVCQPVQLGTASIGCVLLGVEQPNPEPGCPGHLYLTGSPGLPGSQLVAADELVGLGDGGCFAWAACGWPHCGGQADDRLFGLSDDAVPVVDG